MNQALDLESWDGKFHAVSLYRSIEHLVSDIKNIKYFLCRIERYIKGKFIIDSNANDIKDLDGIGLVVYSLAVWKFLSAVYDSHLRLTLRQSLCEQLQDLVQKQGKIQI